MARQAQIIDQIEDAFGDLWDVREYRATEHGFSIALGWPEDSRRGQGGCGGARVVVTPQLAAYLENLRLTPAAIKLPIGRTAIKRARRLLGHHWQIDRADWWQQRIEDLADMTVEEFCQAHSVSAGSAINARHAFFGPILRPAGWWRVPDAANILLSQRPTSSIADDLDMSAASVRRLRAKLMSEQ